MIAESLAYLLESISESMPAPLLLVGACIGHGYFMIVGLNVIYAWPLPHQVLKYTRKIDLLIIFGGPVLFAWSMDLFSTQRLSWDPGEARAWVSPYLVFCAVVGFV